MDTAQLLELLGLAMVLICLCYILRSSGWKEWLVSIAFLASFATVYWVTIFLFGKHGKATWPVILIVFCAALLWYRVFTKVAGYLSQMVLEFPDNSRVFWLGIDRLEYEKEGFWIEIRVYHQPFFSNTRIIKRTSLQKWNGAPDDHEHFLLSEAERDDIIEKISLFYQHFGKKYQIVA